MLLLFGKELKLSKVTSKGNDHARKSFSFVLWEKLELEKVDAYTLKYDIS